MSTHRSAMRPSARNASVYGSGDTIAAIAETSSVANIPSGRYHSIRRQISILTGQSFGRVDTAGDSMGNGWRIVGKGGRGVRIRKSLPLSRLSYRRVGAGRYQREEGALPKA